MNKLPILVSEHEIQKMVADAAQWINNRYKDNSRPIALVGILKGCIPFLADVARQVTCPVKMLVLKASSYENNHSTGHVRIELDLDGQIENHDVVVIEDIIDTGLTLARIVEYLKVKKPSSISIACLLQKDRKKIQELKIDWCGKIIPDKFVVGYGLDCDEYGRNFPNIVVYEG